MTLSSPAGTALPMVRPACRAPWVSMFFDTLGQVRACCVNHHFALGHLAAQRLPEIWHGPRAEALRRALAEGDFSHGCEHCRWQFDDGTAHLAHARKYDAYPASGPEAVWPSNMEFNLSNTCNLECPMCSGELSSAIRSRRDRLPPLPKVYGDQFFDDLRPFLPHLRSAQFLGGEPLLVREHFRVWEMMIADGLDVRCEITTNGTQLTPQVERILDRLPVSINISLDGITAATVETLRKNARLEVVLANYERFRAYCRQRGTAIGFNFSLMRQNWHEFGQFLEFAESGEVLVSVCTVVYPARFSLYSLPPGELAEVVESFDRQDADIRRRLRINLAVWDATREKLRQRVAHAGSGTLDFVPAGFADAFDPARSVSADLVEQARRELAAWAPGQAVSGLICDDQDQITALEGEAEEFLGIPARLCLGRQADSILGHLRVVRGPHIQILRWNADPERLDRILELRTPLGGPTWVRLLVVPRREPGSSGGTLLLAAATDQRPETV